MLPLLSVNDFAYTSTVGFELFTNKLLTLALRPKNSHFQNDFIREYCPWVSCTVNVGAISNAVRLVVGMRSSSKMGRVAAFRIATNEVTQQKSFGNRTMRNGPSDMVAVVHSSMKTSLSIASPKNRTSPRPAGIWTAALVNSTPKVSLVKWPGVVAGAGAKFPRSLFQSARSNVEFIATRLAEFFRPCPSIQVFDTVIGRHIISDLRHFNDVFRSSVAARYRSDGRIVSQSTG